MKEKWEDSFEELYRTRGQQKYGIGLLALWKIQAGVRENAVCAFLKKTPFTIRKWRRLYESEGLEGLLQIGKGRGRKGILKKEDEGKFKEALQKASMSLKGGRIRGIDIQEILRMQFKAEYGRAGVYELLERLGYSWITSRSMHPKADKVAQEIFKKRIP